MIKLLVLIITLVIIILFLLNKIFRNLLIERLKKNTFIFSLSAVMTILLLLGIFFFNRNNTGTYAPPYYDGEKVVPGQIINE